jgi:hypothetical protein
VRKPARPQPKQPTQRAIDRWSGESPAPAPEPAGAKTTTRKTAAAAPVATPPDLAVAVRALLEAVEVLVAAPGRRPEFETAKARDALERARLALGPPQGQGQMPRVAQQAHDAQRADPSRSPHFGG